MTACALLEYEDCIEYRFASNQLSDGQLQEVTQFITEVLKTLQKARPTRLDLIRSQLLQQVVMFCRKKIQAYITALVKQISDCVESQDCNRSVLYELEMVQSLSIEADDRNLDQDSCEPRLIQGNLAYKTPSLTPNLLINQRNEQSSNVAKR